VSTKFVCDFVACRSGDILGDIDGFSCGRVMDGENVFPLFDVGTLVSNEIDVALVVLMVFCTVLELIGEFADVL